ncbi:MAG: minichromosome maintenance protein MCM [Candidatus Aenigmarchaeota archaeon]|nr:minichromosome maintenance protein MCM [Candidatus Aenigmarchaeota archaeon]
MEALKVTDERLAEFTAKLKEFLHERYYQQMVQAANEEKPAVVSFRELDKFEPAMAELLVTKPDDFFEIAKQAVEQTDLPAPIRVRIDDMPEIISIRDLRSRHVGKFIAVEGIVRRASEIRPEIVKTVYECSECLEPMEQERKGNFIFKPLQCKCGSRKAFKELEKVMIDTRWITIEEPFELTEGERPSQVNIWLTEDLVSTEGRRMTEPGNRLRITGVLRDVPKGKSFSAKLDFFLEANHATPTEVGWERIKLTKQDEEEIKRLAADENIYETLVDSLAPSLYGMREIKESVIMQMFSGVARILPDKTRFRGEIHILLIGDPASGKSQLMKLVPQIVPRGKYVSGKGTTAAGLTATVSKDEQFMGGWVLEAGAMVMAHKGILSVDEFEKMSPEDQVAMHEGLEQGSISIAKASIVATLPAQTSVLAGGNPKFSRFDPYLSIAKQITIPDTLLSRFDLKFALKDVPDSEVDKKVVDHVLKSRHPEYESAKPKLPPEFVRKYIAYAKDTCKPELSDETEKLLKSFYIKTRKKAEGGAAPIPITLRQFEGLVRLSEAAAKIQLSPIVKKEHAQRAIRLMRFSLRQLGFDPETGAIDIDKTEGGTSFTERSRIKVVLDIINELSQKKKEIPISELEDRARKEGVEDVDEVIDRLKREGMLFEPSPGFLQRV